MSPGRVASSLVLAVLAFLASVAHATAYQLGTYRLEVPAGGAINYPMEGAKFRAVLTNQGAGRVFTSFVAARIKETGTPLQVLPTPRYLEPGESMTVSVFADAGAGALPPGTPSAQTLVWQLGGDGFVEVPFTITNWMGAGGTLATPAPGQGIPVSVQVVDDAGRALPNVPVFARAGPVSVTLGPGPAGGTYVGTLPPSGHWVVSAEARGRRTAYLPLDDPSKYAGRTLALMPYPVFVTYGAAVAKEAGIGPWMGRANAAQDAILLSAAMELWADAMKPTVVSAKVRLYGAEGVRRWEFAPGYEAKAVDLSPDGRWAAVATLDPSFPSGSSSNTAGPPGALYLLDASSGQPMWSLALDAAFMRSAASGIPAPPNGFVPAVREVRFSPDGSLIAVGDHYGDLVVVPRTFPTQLVMRANLGGDLRAIRFSADGSRVYAAFGSGLTAAFRVGDGTQLWRAETYSWVHPEGLVLSPDGTKLGVMAQGGDVVMLDAATGAVLWQRDTKALSWWASFSGDGTVFLAGTQTGGTWGLDARTGAVLYALAGGKGGGFPAGRGHFLLGNQALYDQRGTRISNFIAGLEGTRFGNWQVAWVSPDGLSLVLGEQQSDSPTMPVVYSVKGQATGAPVTFDADVQEVVTRYYRTILGRDPEPTGLRYWSDEAARMAWLGADVKEVFYAMATTFFASPEYVGKATSDAQFIRDLYATFFGRAADDPGLAYWQGELASLQSRSALLNSFLFSPEFTGTMAALFGPGTVRPEVDMTMDFFRGALGRLPDSDGYAYWLGQVRIAQCSGAAAVSGTAGAVASLFFTSPEYLGRARPDREFMADVYDTYLRRGPGGDAGGFNFWVNNLPALGRDGARANFVPSAEFQARVGAVIAAGCLGP